MTLWRKNVQTLIDKCGQHAVLTMTRERYIGSLVEAGADEDEAEELAEWMSRVIGEEGDG